MRAPVRAFLVIGLVVQNIVAHAEFQLPNFPATANSRPLRQLDRQAQASIRLLFNGQLQRLTPARIRLLQNFGDNRQTWQTNLRQIDNLIRRQNADFQTLEQHALRMRAITQSLLMHQSLVTTQYLKDLTLPLAQRTVTEPKMAFQTYVQMVGEFWHSHGQLKEIFGGALPNLLAFHNGIPRQAIDQFLNAHFPNANRRQQTQIIQMIRSMESCSSLFHSYLRHAYPNLTRAQQQTHLMAIANGNFPNARAHLQAIAANRLNRQLPNAWDFRNFLQQYVEIYKPNPGYQLDAILAALIQGDIRAGNITQADLRRLLNNTNQMVRRVYDPNVQAAWPRISAALVRQHRQLLNLAAANNPAGIKRIVQRVLSSARIRPLLGLGIRVGSNTSTAAQLGQRYERLLNNNR